MPEEEKIDDLPVETAIDEQLEMAGQSILGRKAIIYLSRTVRAECWIDIEHRMAHVLDLSIIFAETPYEVGDFKLINYGKQQTRKGTIRRSIRDRDGSRASSRG